MLRFLSSASIFVSQLTRSRQLSRIAKASPVPASTSVRAAVLVIPILFFALVGSSAGQSFTLTMAAFDPFAINPGGSATSLVTLVAGTGFTGTVDLTCQVLPQPNATPPTCSVSPPSVSGSGSATATIGTVASGGTAVTPGSYTVVVTGTVSGTTTSQQGSQTITILSVNPQFTITVQSPVIPTSVHAGSGGLGTININPIFGYSSPAGTGVTLSCASITPLVTIPPVCSFNPNPVPVKGVVATSQISITTFGPIPTGAVAGKRSFYAVWFPVPLIALAGLGAAVSGRRAKRAWGLLALFIVAGSVLLMPACAHTINGTSTSTPNGVTPNNSYTFTLQGVDVNGNISSNTGTANAAPTVTLTVN
jgi:hypothetical protein